MVRLVFRPYTQVRRTICTSVSLRASTRVSSGFAPLRHSSPSFGSRQACSHSNPSQKIRVGRRCNPQAGIPHVSFLLLSGIRHPRTRKHVRLLGPCFKTGQTGSSQAVANAQRHEGTPTESAFWPTTMTVTPRATTAWAQAVNMARNDPHLEPSGRPTKDDLHPAKAQRQPPSASLPTISSTL